MSTPTFVAFLTTFSLLLVAQSFAAEGGQADTKALAQTALKQLDNQDTYQVIESIAAQGPRDAVDVLVQLQLDIYWKRKDVRLSNAIAQAGITLALAEAAKHDENDKDLADNFRASAKIMAYNIGSYSWPGWAEPGVTLTASDIAAGRDAARANLRISTALQKSDLTMSRAYWLVGAHELSAGDHKAAQATFDTAAAFANRAESKPDALLNAGYMHINTLVADADDVAAQKKLADIKAQLTPLKEGKFFADQLDAVLVALTARKAQAAKEAPMSDALAFTLNDIAGKPTELGKYRGEVVMIVNVASKCGLTPQYKELQALYEKYNAQGFTILGFPANNFGKQEPGTDEQIAEFCDSKFGVEFPMFSKISVKGDDKHALYQYLTSDASGQPGEISWNFEKFLVGRDGKVVARFTPKTKPDAADVITTIEAQLAAK